MFKSVIESIVSFRPKGEILKARSLAKDRDDMIESHGGLRNSSTHPTGYMFKSVIESIVSFRPKGEILKARSLVKERDDMMESHGGLRNSFTHPTGYGL
jgi:hypothetical protein